MTFIDTKINGLFIIEPVVYKDERGYFFENFRVDLFEQKSQGTKFVQENESFSNYGVLRGLHYQLPPFAQSKLVRVVAGKVLDVALDIRKYSSTFGQHFSIELSGENKKQVFIPQGFAHGYVVLSEMAILQYKVDNYYSKEFERGILYNDPNIKINWHLEHENILISGKDKLNKLLVEADCFIK